jgi:hypothetical protein
MWSSIHPVVAEGRIQVIKTRRRSVMAGEATARPNRFRSTPPIFLYSALADSTVGLIPSVLSEQNCHRAPRPSRLAVWPARRHVNLQTKSKSKWYSSTQRESRLCRPFLRFIKRAFADGGYASGPSEHRPSCGPFLHIMLRRPVAYLSSQVQPIRMAGDNACASWNDC